MAWKVKDEYKDYKPTNMNLAYGQLLQHQIENLSDEVKDKYFTNESKSKKKKVKTKKVEIEDDLDFIGGNNGN
jgi:hypothetical protein|tara:strand:+ start:166 stop:384 length:219 start_codon:yes stop_codon:yes gene_type:complete